MSKVPDWLPVSCENCKHLDRDALLLYAAYPKGIPVWIRGNINSHRTPQPGDHGIQYEPTDSLLQELEEAGIIV
jgi:hypothetical protein